MIATKIPETHDKKSEWKRNIYDMDSLLTTVNPADEIMTLISFYFNKIQKKKKVIFKIMYFAFYWTLK